MKKQVTKEPEKKPTVPAPCCGGSSCCGQKPAAKADAKPEQPRR